MNCRSFAPARVNPKGTTPVVHFHRFSQDTDACYPVAAAIEADIALALEALTAELQRSHCAPYPNDSVIRSLHTSELKAGEDDDGRPLKPQRIINDIRNALGDEDVVLADTGAIKMWMARLYPTFAPLTCIISNGLSTMAFSLPGAMGAKLARPKSKVLATIGDGSFLMNSKEIETAIREKIPLVVLVWVDDAYGLIKWKMDLELGHHRDVDFGNPDFVRYAESFGARGDRIKSAAELLPALREALASDGVSIIACPVDPLWAHPHASWRPPWRWSHLLV